MNNPKKSEDVEREAIAFADLKMLSDKLLDQGGFRKGELIVLAAGTNQGKSSLGFILINRVKQKQDYSDAKKE